MDRKSWERRNSFFALNETNQQLESKRLELYHADQWAYQAHMEDNRLFGEVTTKNRTYQECHAKDCQQIEELRRVYCQEAERARQLRTDALSLRQKGGPSTVNQLLSQIQEPQDKVNSLNEETDFCDPETSLECPTFPIKPISIPCPSELPRIHGTRWVLQETFLKIYLLKKGYLQHSSRIQRNLWDCHETWSRIETRTAEFHNTDSSIYLAFVTPLILFIALEDLIFKNCMMEAPRDSVSELHVETFPNPVTFNVGESTWRPKCV